MIRNKETDKWLDQMLQKGEFFTFKNGRADTKEFESWVKNAKDFLLNNDYLTEEKIERRFYDDDEGYYYFLAERLRRIYVVNRGVWG